MATLEVTQSLNSNIHGLELDVCPLLDVPRMETELSSQKTGLIS